MEENIDVDDLQDLLSKLDYLKKKRHMPDEIHLDFPW